MKKQRSQPRLNTPTEQRKTHNKSVDLPTPATKGSPEKSGQDVQHCLSRERERLSFYAQLFFPLCSPVDKWQSPRVIDIYESNLKTVQFVRLVYEPDL